MATAAGAASSASAANAAGSSAANGAVLSVDAAWGLNASKEVCTENSRGAVGSDAVSIAGAVDVMGTSITTGALGPALSPGFVDDDADGPGGACQALPNSRSA